MDHYALGTTGRRGDPPASPEGEADGGQARRNGDTVIRGRGQATEDRGHTWKFLNPKSKIV